MRRRVGWRRTAHGVLLAAFLMAVSACDPSAPPGSPGSGSAGRQVESNGGTYRVTYSTAPDPIPLNQPFALQFSIHPRSSPAGKSADLGVEVDARMPAHFHGMTRTPRVSRRPDGSFIAEGMLFHMPGRWEVYVDISRDGGVERAQWQVDLQ